MSRIEQALRRARHVPDESVEPQDRREGVSSLTLMHSTSDFTDVDEYRSEREAGPTSGSVGPIIPPLVGEIRSSTPARNHLEKDTDEKLVVHEGIPPIVIEQYRRLAAALHQVQVERGTKVVMVASAMAGEGKTLTAANLSVALSRSFQRRVLLIDADLRRPTVHEVFRISNVRGLNDGLRPDYEGKLPLVELSPTLTVLPAGAPNPDPLSGLTSDRMRRVVDEASKKYEWVVIDTPPVGLLPDANLLAEMADMVVLVVGAGRTPYRSIQRAIDALDRNRIIGVVLNRAAQPASAYEYYQYYSGAPNRT